MSTAALDLTDTQQKIMPLTDTTFRQAKVGDVPTICSIINNYAEQGLMLHRSHAEMYERLRDYQVADHEGQVVGVCGLRIMWGNLAEVYALAVAPQMRGKGIGQRLVEAVVDDARHMEIRKLFTLTYERAFFERCGFDVVDRHQMLPLKVWSECHRCPKNQACDEIAMMRILEEVPDRSPPAEKLRPNSLYEVPVLSAPMKRVDLEAREE
ncbi:MAG: N-acetyltransferase [Planctomycetes bacterium]|nr:N-acetyltransferase [Planctomycetota bacterium]